MPEQFLPGVTAAGARFKPRTSDVFLASFPKSGTAWLKALAFATLSRADHPPCRADHPLRLHNPHDCVDFLETAFAGSRSAADDAFASLPSSHLIATHNPYPLLPARVTAEGLGPRIVYICRDPKDALLSMWLFAKKLLLATPAAGHPPTIEEAFDLFCDGRFVCGPHWHHVAGYWEASRRSPDKMLQDPVSNLRRLAEFMGCAFSAHEEAEGMVQDVVELCSIDALKNLDLNKNGAQEYVKNESFFRKGVAGDWSNHMTSTMAARLDKIVEDALQGSSPFST